MTGTIFGDVKEAIGLAADNTPFDDTLLLHINGALSNVTRVGAGNQDGFVATKTSTWSDFSTDTKMISQLKNYLVFQVKLMFDSSTMSSFVLTSYQELAKEALWTINNYADYWNQSHS